MQRVASREFHRSIERDVGGGRKKGQGGETPKPTGAFRFFRDRPRTRRGTCVSPSVPPLLWDNLDFERFRLTPRFS